MDNIVAIRRRLFGTDELKLRVTLWLQLDINKKEPRLGNQWVESWSDLRKHRMSGRAVPDPGTEPLRAILSSEGVGCFVFSVSEFTMAYLDLSAVNKSRIILLGEMAPFS